MVTNEQVNAVLARSGLSLEGFEAFRKRKHGEQKQTKESWLKDFKTCSHCTRDGKCKYQHSDTTRKNRLCVKVMC